MLVAMRLILVVLSVVLPLLVLAQEVYKSTGPGGVPLFSDQAGAGAQKIEIEPLPSIQIRVPVSASEGGSRSQQRPAPPPGPIYSSLVIESPADDSVVWADSGPVAVLVVAKPPIPDRVGHAIGLRLDGKLLPVRSQRGNITLEGVDRGTHTLQAVVVDAGGEVITESRPITLHLKRHSVLRHP